MHKRQIVFIISLTVMVILGLSFFIGITLSSVNDTVTRYCFNELDTTSKQLAADLYKSADIDRVTLSAMAAIISGSDELTSDELSVILNAYNSDSSYVSYVELLSPDNTILGADGTVRSVEGDFDFEQDAKKGAYISGIAQSTLDPDEKVIRSSMPVVRDGETVYILYGVIRLSELAQKFTTDIYGGHTYVYIVDSDTGDFLLDTWHNSYGNTKDFSQRRMLPGYSFDTVDADMKKGVGGNLGFVSKTTGNVLYMHYEPVDINNWYIMVTVEQDYALSQSEAVSSSLYRMAGFIAIVMLLYMVCVGVSLVRAYRRIRVLGTEDQATGLLNRNAYDRYINDNRNKIFESITCIYIDANGLHEINNKFGHAAGDQMLKIIADALKAEFQDSWVYRIGGDEFVVFSEEDDMKSGIAKMQEAVGSIEAHEYYIAFGMVCRKNETGVDRITREADEKMLENKRLYYTNHDRRRSR